MEQNPFAYFSLALGALILSILIMRWIFSIDRHLKNQKATIALLIKMCRRQGVNDEEIDEIKNTFDLK